MFAVISTGGRQYKVAPNDLVAVERLPGEYGESLELNQVLMVSDGSTTAVGKPIVKGAKVAVEIVEQGRGDKITVLKFKRRKKYRRTLGHRQEITLLRVIEINAPGIKTLKTTSAKAKSGPQSVDAAPEKSTTAKKTAAKKTAAKKASAKGSSTSKAAATKRSATTTKQKTTKKES